ncbi:SulP family inorganic anion transporter [Cellulosimicrobium cellulans]|uniref:SulP family inorganic anion transporter n=1 Tax=Cellulosimicrobium cellulans TaxID=1710 RepID=UPI001EDA0C7D|nr:SulP family inorganic anion transporter [Cellulosimicrobium cellulans]UKJ65132.1 SulP family inorganic anion transporter [Cellulosimicrobium cellulans]
MSRLAAVRDLLPRRSDYDLRPRTLRADLLAGVTVGVVALPLALAFGVSSGVGAAAGLVTAVIAGIVAAVLGGSNHQVSGPTGAMAVVLAPIVVAHGPGSVALVTVLAGLVVLVAGLARLGRVVTYIPWPVVEGFRLGIACIIFLQQVPAAVGVEAAPGHNTFVTAVEAVRTAVTDVPPAPVLWTLGCVAVVAATMLLLPRAHAAIPASLVAVVLATVLVEALGAPVPRIGALPSSLPAPVLPTFTPGALRDLGGAALAIAALAAIESLLSARVAASMVQTGSPGGSVYQPDRELVGQGLASVASGLFGGMPATGAIARTAVNVRSGARTRLAAVVHAVVILAVIYLATGPVSRIPLAALAGVLMVTSFRMIGARTIRSVVGAGRSSAATFVVTAVVTVAFDLVQAIEIGILVAAFFALRTVARASAVHRDPLPGPAQPGDEHVALFRLEGSMFFGAADRVLTEVTDASSHHDVAVVVLRLSQLRMVDATGARALGELVEGLEARGVTVLVKGVQERHRSLLTNVGALAELRHENHLFDTLDDAIEHARSHVRRAARGTDVPQVRGLRPST